MVAALLCLVAGRFRYPGGRRQPSTLGGSLSMFKSDTLALPSTLRLQGLDWR
jgi:hypothetical protein